MATRKGGFIGQDGLNAPDEPTNVSASAGDEQASVSFTAPSDVGGAAVSGYRVTDSTGAFGASGSASPITVSGLTNGSSYTFRVWALNPFGWSSPSDASGSVSPQAPIGLVAGGNAFASAIDYFSMGSTGNTAEFGELTVGRDSLGACSSATRGLWMGGNNGLNVIDYVEFATLGNATDFGDLAIRSQRGNVGLSNATIGISAGGEFSPTNTIQYITIASTGDSLDWGDLTAGRSGLASAASPTRGLMAGGYSSGNVIDYITFSSAGNAVDFGDLLTTTYEISGGSSSTRAVFGGGNAYTNVIQYVTIAATGNATDFGDLTAAKRACATCASSTYLVFCGGFNGAALNVMDYVTIATTGNALDWGDLRFAKTYAAGCSSGHGGLS